MPFAIIGMGRLGGSELSYASDADVLFVYEPPPGMAEDAASGAAHQIAEELRRLLAAPAPEPPLGVDADLRPEGRQGPLVRSLAAYERYYARWSKIWEAQALLRARFVCGDADARARASWRWPTGCATRPAGSPPSRSPRSAGSRPGWTPSGCPAAPTRPPHTKLGRGGLADVEWTVQLLQLRHGHRVPALRTPRTLEALTAAPATPGWSSTMDAVVAGSRLGHGDPRPQRAHAGPRPAERPAAPAGHGAGRRRPGPGRPGHTEPGEFLDDYLRTARRARAAAERVFLP